MMIDRYLNSWFQLPFRHFIKLKKIFIHGTLRQTDFRGIVTRDFEKKLIDCSPIVGAHLAGTLDVSFCRTPQNRVCPVNSARFLADLSDGRHNFLWRGPDPSLARLATTKPWHSSRR